MAEYNNSPCEALPLSRQGRILLKDDDEMRRRIAGMSACYCAQLFWPYYFATYRYLPVTSAGPPTTADEFLLRSKWEAKQLPNILVADLDSSHSPDEMSKSSERTSSRVHKNVILEGVSDTIKSESLSTKPHDPYAIALCPKGMKPCTDWESKILADFSDLRQYLCTMRDRIGRGENGGYSQRSIDIPNRNDGKGWRRLCFGVGYYSCSNLSSGVAALSGAPSMTLLMSMDTLTVKSVLSHHVSWLDSPSSGSSDESDDSLHDANNGTPNDNDGRHCLSVCAAAWLYALLACLDKPLCLNSAAVVRQIFRRCCYIRSNLSTGRFCSNDIAPRQLSCLNLLITISGHYFGQAGKDARWNLSTFD